jgi:CHASE3 domain sensor protein
MLGFVLLALVVVMSVLFTAKERATNQYVQTALLTEDRLEDTLSTMREAENGVRGYLLTGNPISLHTYNLAIAASPRNLAALDAVLAGSPDAAQLAEVHQMVRDKFSQLAQAMALAQSGQQAAAAALINTDLNLGTMVNLRAAIGQMRDDEEQRLEAAEAQAGHQGFVLQTATALAALATLLLAWFAIRANAAQTGRLVAAEAALLAANETLEQKLGDLDRIFNLSTDILAVNSFERQFIAISPAWERITGRPVAAGAGSPGARCR